ncbi:hypothetical protein D3C72_927530 [compost metagenome]
MPLPDNADQSIPEQGLAAHLRARSLFDDAGFQIDASFTKRRAVLVRLLEEEQADAGRVLRHPLQQTGSKALYEAVAGPQGVGPGQLSKIKAVVGTQHGPRIVNDLANAVPKLGRSGGRDQPSPGSDQQGVAGRFAQSRQRAAHRRGAKP